MIQLIIYMYTLTSSFIFIQMNHPLAMGLMLLIQTLFISMISGLFSKTFWFSYILFLIFLGGMLVLFIYVTSLASNEMFSMSMKLMILSMFMMMIMTLIFILLDKSLYSMFTFNLEMMSINDMMMYTQENKIILNKLYNFPTNLVTFLLINYLLLTLIAIVKITNIFYGPLRPMN